MPAPASESQGQAGGGVLCCLPGPYLSAPLLPRCIHCWGRSRCSWCQTKLLYLLRIMLAADAQLSPSWPRLPQILLTECSALQREVCLLQPASRSLPVALSMLPPPCWLNHLLCTWLATSRCRAENTGEREQGGEHMPGRGGHPSRQRARLFAGEAGRFDGIPVPRDCLFPSRPG